jgi:CDC-like kinase
MHPYLSGHMDARPGDVIMDRYEICRELGVGTFGKVYKCFDAKHKDFVAIKVVRRIDKYIESARIEADILSDVYSRQKQEKCNFIVKLLSHFLFRGYYCLVFERLGMSLYDFFKQNNYKGLPLSHVRKIASQLLAGVDFLHRMHLIHTDLKLENILLMSNGIVDYTYPNGSIVKIPTSCRLKIIDFGGATYDDEPKSTCINTRQYRGPEITLELPWSFPSDVWSVGCIVAECYSGDLLFATHDNLEHLALMEKCLGRFPRTAASSPVHPKYFHRSGLVRVEKLSRDSQRHVEKMQPLAGHFRRTEGDAESGIVQLLRGLLMLDASRRSTAEEALHDLDFFPGPVVLL